MLQAGAEAATQLRANSSLPCPPPPNCRTARLKLSAASYTSGELVCIGSSAALDSAPTRAFSARAELMSANPVTCESVRGALLEAGLEVLRVQEQAVHLAARVRSHLMDAGVRVRCAAHLGVEVTVRAQSSDFPSDPAETLFARVRAAVGGSAESRGFHETAARPREIRDPVDDSRLLDVWYELTFTKDASQSSLLDDVRWALGLPKCIER